MSDQPALAARCVLPTCDEPMDRWPGRCRRIAGHGDDFHGPPNPFLNTLICRVCDKEMLADEPYRKVVRFSWLPGRGGYRRAFEHDLRAVKHDFVITEAHDLTDLLATSQAHGGHRWKKYKNRPST